MNPPLKLPMPVEALIPHRLPIRVIDQLVEISASQGVVESFIRPDSIFIKDDHSIEQVIMVELIAQSFAAVKGYSDLLNGKPLKKGFLVEVKRFSFNGTVFVGDKLSIIIHRIGETAEFALAEGKVMQGENIIASGRVMVWIP
jgi:predicted hotdog family 3-hydroxylacyl-ACP dehydratase